MPDATGERSQVEAAQARVRAEPELSREALGVLLGVLDREQPELAHVVRCWEKLPEPMRAAVLALVKAATSAGP